MTVPAAGRFVEAPLVALTRAEPGIQRSWDVGGFQVPKRLLDIAQAECQVDRRGRGAFGRNGHLDVARPRAIRARLQRRDRGVVAVLEVGRAGAAAGERRDNDLGDAILECLADLGHGERTGRAEDLEELGERGHRRQPRRGDLGHANDAEDARMGSAEAAQSRAAPAR